MEKISPTMEHMAAVGHVGLLAVDEGRQILAVDEGLLAATVGHMRLLAVDTKDSWPPTWDTTHLQIANK